MADECHSKRSISEAATSIASKMLHTIEDSYDAVVVVTPKHFPQISRFRLNDASFRCYTAKPKSSDVDMTPSETRSKSAWRLGIATEDARAAKEYQVLIDVISSSPTTSLEKEPLKQSHETFPELSVHLAVADFIEENVHVNFDVMALQASNVAFEALGRSGVSPEATRFKIRVNDITARSPVKNSPENNPPVRALPEKNPYRKISSAPKKSWTFNGLQYSLRNLQAKANSEAESHQILLALGSNVGNRIGMIEQACEEMTRRGIGVVQTSSLYETEAMYKTDQPSFVNGVCKVCQACRTASTKHTDSPWL